MPLLRSKYQPYFPDPDSPNNYNCDRATYCHPVQLGDTIYTQFYQTPCNQNEIEDPVFDDKTIGAESLSNPSFTGSATDWFLGGNWLYGTNNIVHTLGSLTVASQTALALPLVAGFYQVTIDITRTSGSVRVGLGLGSNGSYTNYYDTTGTFTSIIYFNDIADQIVAIYPNPTDDFDGAVNSISVKEVTYNSWDANGSWLFADGLACHIEGTTGLLEESVANYIVGNSYYYIEVTISGYVQGSLDVYISDALAGTVTANGTFRYYDTPTIAGVVSFDPSSDFIGCISAPDLRLLKNSHVADLVTQDGVSRYDVSNYLAYWEDKVTLSLNIEDLEVTDGCYYLEVFDACQIEGNELVTNGDFTDGVTDWTRNNGFGQYDFSANSAEFIFDPITGLTSILTNGDFSAGATGWTPLGAGWSISGGGALHTAGSTATLVQTLAILPSPPPPSVEVYWVQFTVSGRTAGSCTVRFGNSTIFSAGANDTFLFPVNPNIAGSVNLTFTPTSNFDGTIDDVSLFVSNQVWSDSVFLFNTVNPDFIAGNYLLEFEITAQSDPDIRVGIRVDGSPFTFFNTVGVHQVVLNNYTPGGQRVTLLASFVSGSNRLPGTVTVDNVSAVRIEPFEATYTSECLQYKELWGQRTRIITAYCDQESFGFEFQNTGFRLQQRVGVRSIAPTYPKEKQIQRSGNGSARVVYSGVEKYWQLHTAPTTETFHDAMAIMVDCDHFAIGETSDNATEYIVEVEDYTPQWTQDGSFSLAPVVMTLRIKEGGQKFNRHT